MAATGKPWRVLVEHEYEQGDIDDPRVGDFIWLKDGTGRPFLVKVHEILPPATTSRPARSSPVFRGKNGHTNKMLGGLG